MIGRLLYLNFTRPDISYSTQYLSQFMQQLKKPHLDATLHLVRYLKQYPEQGLYFSKENNYKIRAFCDSDWASCPMTRKSTMDFCVFLGSSMISYLLKDFMVTPPLPIILHCDNKVAEHIAANPQKSNSQTYSQSH